MVGFESSLFLCFKHRYWPGEIITSSIIYLYQRHGALWSLKSEKDLRSTLLKGLFWPCLSLSHLNPEDYLVDPSPDRSSRSGFPLVWSFRFILWNEFSSPPLLFTCFSLDWLTCLSETVFLLLHHASADCAHAPGRVLPRPWKRLPAGVRDDPCLSVPKGGKPTRKKKKQQCKSGRRKGTGKRGDRAKESIKWVWSSEDCLGVSWPHPPALWLTGTLQPAKPHITESSDNQTRHWDRGDIYKQVRCRIF